MSDTFRIAINQGPIFGILSYNVNTKEVIIDFPKEDIKKQAELYQAYEMIQYDIVSGEKYSLQTNFFEK